MVAGENTSNRQMPQAGVFHLIAIQLNNLVYE